MQQQKLKIQVTDFIPEYGKHPTGIKDKEGTMLCLGDAVQDARGDKHLVAYRYGNYCLKQPYTMHSISLKDGQVTKLNEVWAAQEYLIIGYAGEPVIDGLIELFPIV
jgi:hypothetical protein